jgi:flagellar hook-length control protein FliK
MPVAPAASSPTTERVALDAVVELPKPMASAKPVTLPGQAAADVTEDSADTLTHDSLDLFPVSGMFAPSTDEQVPDSSSDSSLDDIRQRMALIESAGQLDNASVVVVPTAPVQVIVTASATTGDSTGSASLLADSAALQTANASFDIDADFGKAIDLDADTDSNSALPTAQPAATALAFQVDSQGAAQVVTENAMQPLTGAFATVLQDLRMQTDDTLVDSQPDGSNAVSGAASVTADAQSGFTMAALGLGTTGLIRASQTVGNDLELSPAIGTTAWQDGLGQQVIDMFKRGEKQVDLRLNPSELGPLSISLNLNDGNTQAQFQSAHASVRSAVEQALPQLRDALASQGITLGQTSVGDDPSRSSGQPRRDAQSDGGFTPSNRGVEPVPQLNELPTQTLLVGGLGVDLYI